MKNENNYANMTCTPLWFFTSSRLQHTLQMECQPAHVAHLLKYHVKVCLRGPRPDTVHSILLRRRCVFVTHGRFCRSVDTGNSAILSSGAIEECGGWRKETWSDDTPLFLLDEDGDSVLLKNIIEHTKNWMKFFQGP